MSKIHVVDRFLNETLEYDCERDSELHRIVKYIKHEYNEDKPDAPIITVELDNGICLYYYDNDVDAFTDEHRIVYAPVYDVERCEKEEYSIYEEEDIIGFVNRNYDYADYLDI